jgi:hypothetical protein
MAAGSGFGGAGSGNVSTGDMGPGDIYGGPGADYNNILMAAGSNPIIEKKGLATSTEPSTTTTTEKKKKVRGRSENLMTGPLGVTDEPGLETKSLMIRALRSTLG